MKNFFLLILVGAFINTGAVLGQEINAEQVIAHHLESIGTSQKRSELKNSIVEAELRFGAMGATQPVVGKAVLVASGEKNLLGMVLSSNDYPQDKFGYDGKQVKAGFTRPGIYSAIGGFLLSYKEILKDGLLGGTLFSSWAMHRVDVNKPKLSFSGKKKIDQLETYVIDYGFRGGSDLTVKLYFDSKYFRHVRTEYSHVIAARQGTSVDNSAGQSPERYKVVEDFSDFQTVSGITLPKKYKLSYSYSGVAGTRSIQSAYRELEWTFDVTNFTINQDIDPATFLISSR